MLRNLAYIVLGYIVAVTVASIIVVGMFYLPTGFPNSRSILNSLQDFVGTILIGMGYTATFALPGFLLTLIFAYKKQKEGKFYFALCGLATAILAHGIAATALTPFPSFVILLSLFGGFFGGLAYRYVAGKKVFQPKSVNS